MNKRNFPQKKQSGQVLITGIIMLIVLLLLLLSIFDVHNIIRAKFKFETAQQSAALAGAKWQKESLNLIGELNILKACVTLLEGEKNWDIPLPPDDPEHREARQLAIQGRIDQLTEMQTRVSFIGPMIGFGAAQQAAKANGMRIAKHGVDSQNTSLAVYLNRLLFRKAAGKVSPVNNYDWFEPYFSMISRISSSGVAVLPNARGTGKPSINPPELGNTGFYSALLQHKFEIEKIKTAEKRRVGDQSSWLGMPYKFIKYYKTWTDHILADTRYWDIDYNFSSFPNESEIFTLGVQTGFSSERHWIYEPTFNNSLEDDPEIKKYASTSVLPGEMKWFCFDDTWYPDYYAKRYTDYKEEHFDYWFGGNILRSKVKEKYQYEGAAAYAEATALDIDRAVRFKPYKKFNSSKAGLLRKRNTPAATVGPVRSKADYEGDSFLTGYRPGAIAKVLGELKDEKSPITIPVILPVFDQAVLMPTYMPIPKGFEVLHNYKFPLEDFLVWLADEDTRSVYNYKEPPPQETTEYLIALQTLSKGKEFRYYGYNPEAQYTAQELYEKEKDFLLRWEQNYDNLTYSEQNPRGLGWLQEPKRCTDYGQSYKAGQIVDMTDNIHGGTAKRYYVSKNSYYVIDGRNNVVTNEDVDPTIRYTSHAPGCCCGQCCGEDLVPSSYNGQKGPPRI